MVERSIPATGAAADKAGAKPDSAAGPASDGVMQAARHATATPKSLSIRNHLLVYALMLIVPAVLGALWAAYASFEREQATAQRTMRETVRALSLVIDAEIARRVAILQTLALSPSLRNGDLRSFHQEARDAAGQHKAAIVLVDRNDRIVVNTLTAFGEKTASKVVKSAIDEVRAKQMPRVSDVFAALADGKPMVAINVPVVVNDEVPYILGIALAPADVQQLLDKQRLAPEILGTVLDRQLIVLARTKDAERFVGTRAGPNMRRALEQHNEGFYETKSLDGSPIVSFVSRAPEYGWTFAIGTPRSYVDSGYRAASLDVGLVALLLIAIGTAGAYAFGRRITQSLRNLAADASAIERGETVAPRSTGVLETDQVSMQLANASDLLATATRTLEARVQEAVEESRRAGESMMLSQKREALGRLTAVVAHDFNNLLQTIAMGIHVAAMGAQTERVTRVLSASRRAIDRAAKLTQQLIAFGGSEAQSPHSIDVREQLLATADLLRGALRENIDLHFDVEPTLWPVFVDPTQFELAMLNVALNSRDAMPASGRLEVRALNVPGAVLESGGPAVDVVELRMKDTGHGIPAEVMSRVFDPFFTTKAVGKGSGLGLAQVFAFAQQSGGAVSIESAPGQGATVILRLPRTRNATSNSVLPPLEPSVESGRRILLVEDDLLVNEVVGSALEGAGYEVLRAHNVDDAMAQLSAGALPDIVFSDIVMPGSRNGLDLAREVAERYPNLPILLASGYTEERPASGVRVLQKPYALDTLLEALAAELAAPAAAGAAKPLAAER
ncbi:hypothetical protein BH09PSE5_BH09PSE5_16710 [soil metagenome]